MCTIYKGKPNGLAHIQYNDLESNYYSFEGLGIFTEGQLDKGPFTYIKGNGWKESISCMLEGRPGDSSYRSCFHSDGSKGNVDSLEKETDVSGWQQYSGQSKQGYAHG